MPFILDMNVNDNAAIGSFSGKRGKGTRRCIRKQKFELDRKKVLRLKEGTVSSCSFSQVVTALPVWKKVCWCVLTITRLND